MKLHFPRALWIPFLVVLLSLPAAAFIPNPSFMLGKLVQQRGKMGYRRLQVTMTCADGAGEHAETLYLKVPGLVRRERGSGVIDICRRGQCRRKAPGGGIERLPDWSYLPYLFFVEMDANTSRYLGLLKSLGVDLAVDTIARFHSRIAVVYGAKHWERDRPQFWMDKDDFLPLRLMFLKGKQMVDIQWVEWGSREAGNWFPSRIELHLDGRQVDKCTVSGVKSGMDMPDSLFKLE